MGWRDVQGVLRHTIALHQAIEGCLADLPADQYLEETRGAGQGLPLGTPGEAKLVALLVKKAEVRFGKDRTRIIAGDVIVHIPLSQAEILSCGRPSPEDSEQARRAAEALPVGRVYTLGCGSSGPPNPDRSDEHGFL